MSLTSGIDFQNGKSVLQNLFGSARYAHDFQSSSFMKGDAVYVKGCGSRVKLLKEQLYNLDVQKYVENSSSDEIQVWCKSTSSTGTGNDKSGILGAMKVSDPKHALMLHESGHSLYCRAPMGLEEVTVKPLLQELGKY
jgi:hypothetical protein